MSRSPALLVRSLLFNVLFYVNIIVRMTVALPTILLPRHFLLGVLRRYSRSSLWLLRVTCGVTVEWRGREKIPEGACIVACKHQSFWETFALFEVLRDPTYVLKRELMWLPLFGWLARKARMIPIDRGARVTSLARMTAATRREIADARQIVIFPEGTRQAPGASPRYMPGVAYLYSEIGLPCVPVALNSGQFWTGFVKNPGTIVLAFLEPIPTGMKRREFMAELQQRIETATAELLAEGRNLLAK